MFFELLESSVVYVVPELEDHEAQSNGQHLPERH
jgi:hypothetical protein